MSSATSLLAMVAVGAYLASITLEIDLPDGRQVTSGAAFAGALAGLGGGGLGILPTWPMLAGAAIGGAGVALLKKRSLRSAGTRPFALLLAFGVAEGMGSLTRGVIRGENARALLAGCFAAAAYFVVEVCGTIVSIRNRRATGLALREAMTTVVPLAVVVASTTGLILIAVHRLDWLAFVVMFLPVLATRHEFGRYRETRRAYEETVRALAGLAEGASYVPQGHHERVARMCVAVARELNVPMGRIRQLELAALLHDVGKVALPDPTDVPTVVATEVAENTGRLLEDSGYLEEFSQVVVAAAGGRGDVPLEAKILRIVNGYDELGGPPQDRLRALSASTDRGDQTVLRALAEILSARERNR